MHLASSSYNPSCQERRNITDWCVPARSLAYAHRQQCQLFGAAPNVPAFVISMWNPALATIWNASCRPHIPKSTPRPFFPQPSHIEPPNCGNRDPTAENPVTLLEKTHKVWRARVFHRWIHAFPKCCTSIHFPTTWWWVVDMMMWLAWWCGWHDGGNANHDSRP